MTACNLCICLLLVLQIVSLVNGNGAGRGVTTRLPADIDDIDVDKPKPTFTPPLSFVQKLSRHIDRIYQKYHSSQSPSKSIKEVYQSLRQGQRPAKECNPSLINRPQTQSDINNHASKCNKNGTKSPIAEKLLRIRGGKMIKGNKPKGLTSKVGDAYSQVPFINRYYLTFILICTVIHMTGLPAPELFALSLPNIVQIWRPLTSLSYFGAPSMSLANSLYFLLRYGGMLENLHGSGEYAYFLTIQAVILTLLALVMGFPFTAQMMVTAIIYTCSRLNPMEQIPFQFGFMITSWQLPFCMMIIDCLSQQSAGAAWPHVLGIFAGHLYHFFHDIWPKLGGKQRFVTPKFFLKKFGDRPKGDLPDKGNKEAEKEKRVAEMKKRISKKKGKKLGN